MAYTEEQAKRMELLAQAMMEAVANDDDPMVIAGAIGSVLGCFATVHPDPRSFIGAALTVTTGIVSGVLLEDPAPVVVS